MFMRIFRYRVRPEMQDRHLALQARASQLYSKYVEHPPVYFRSSCDRNLWVELHRYADRDACQSSADLVGQDSELGRLWNEFQDSLDPNFPPLLEEFDEIELPAPINAPPYAQPPIDSRSINNDPVDKISGPPAEPTKAEPTEPVAPIIADSPIASDNELPLAETATLPEAEPQPSHAETGHSVPYVADSPVENNPLPAVDDSDEDTIEVSDDDDLHAQGAPLRDRDDYLDNYRLE